MTIKLSGLFLLLLSNIIVSCTRPSWQSGPPKLYYVSINGDDANPGTKEKPLKTIAKIERLTLQPGDGVFFKGGEIFDGTLSLNVNGSEEKPIEIGSYGDGSAIINGGDKEAIVIRGTNFKLNKVDAKGSGRKTGNITNGISLMNASSGSVDNINTSGFQKSGLDLYNCQNIHVRRVHAFDNGFGGINVGGENRAKSKKILIEESLAENNPGDPTNFNNHSGNGILVGMSDSVVVDHCVATNNGWDMPRKGNGPVGIWTYESSNILIQYCISYRNKTSKGGKDGGGFDLDGGVTNSIIQYCLSYENQGAGYGLFQYAGASLWHNNIVRYCLSINDATTTGGSGGIFIWNGSRDSTQLADCTVYNNLIYSTHSPAIQFEENSQTQKFLMTNNILIGIGQIVNGPTSGEKFEGNVWWNAGGEIRFRAHKDLKAWSDATGQEKLNGEMTGSQTDPLLRGPFTTDLTDPSKLGTLSGYTLLPASQILNRGLPIQELFNLQAAKTDFYGTKVPQGKNPEPGVYEQPER